MMVDVNVTAPSGTVTDVVLSWITRDGASSSAELTGLPPWSIRLQGCPIIVPDASSPHDTWWVSECRAGSLTVSCTDKATGTRWQHSIKGTKGVVRLHPGINEPMSPGW